MSLKAFLSQAFPTAVTNTSTWSKKPVKEVKKSAKKNSKKPRDNEGISYLDMLLFQYLPLNDSLKVVYARTGKWTVPTCLNQICVRRLKFVLQLVFNLDDDFFKEWEKCNRVNPIILGGSAILWALLADTQLKDQLEDFEYDRHAIGKNLNWAPGDLDFFQDIRRHLTFPKKKGKETITFTETTLSSTCVKTIRQCFKWKEIQLTLVDARLVQEKGDRSELNPKCFWDEDCSTQVGVQPPVLDQLRRWLHDHGDFRFLSNTFDGKKLTIDYPEAIALMKDVYWTPRDSAYKKEVIARGYRADKYIYRGFKLDPRDVEEHMKFKSRNDERVRLSFQDYDDIYSSDDDYSFYYGYRR